MSFKVRVCDNCSVATGVKLQLCSRCKYVYYCDQQCQTKHWSIHKHDCKEMEQLAVACKPFDIFCKELRRDKLPCSEPGHNVKACLIQINDLAKFTTNVNIKRLINTPVGMKTINAQYICTTYDNYTDFTDACEAIKSANNPPLEIFNYFNEDKICCLIYCPEIDNYCISAL